MISRRKFVTFAAAGLMAAGTVLGGLPAFVQTAAAAEAAPAVTASADTVREKTSADTYLADALGITADQLSAAVETARLDAIQQALDKGLITQAQADSLKSNQRMGGHGGGLGLFVQDNQIDENALLAKALGITTDKLAAARVTAEDARVAQAVKDGKITQEQADLMKAQQKLSTYLTDKNVYANAVAQAVKDGVITQAQADAILAKSNGRSGFSKGGIGGIGDMRGGRGGR